MFIHRLAFVVKALQKTVRCSVIKYSFAKSGIYSYSLNVILVKCTTDISAEESLHNLGVAKILLSKGEISENNLDKFGVHNNQNSFKDNYCILRCCGVIMTKKERAK